MKDLTSFTRLDKAVRAMPLPATRTFAAVAGNLAKIAPTPLERARAAYVWTTTHIEYSLDRSRDAGMALKDLKGDCATHAAVYSTLCKALSVECVTIQGDVRFAVTPEPALASVSKPIAKGQWLVGHAWNAVRIDGHWGLIDATMGVRAGGNADAPSDDYFLPDPALLATDHVPDDPQWTLGEAPANLSLSPIVRPIAGRLGIEAADLKAEIKPDRLGVSLSPRVAWRSGMRAALQTDAGSVPDRVLVQPSATGTEIRLCPPGPSSTVWLGISVAGAWRPIVGYPVVALACPRLPKVMTRFYDTGASLAGPFSRELPANRQSEIRLRAPGAAQVVAFQGPELAGRFVREGDSWILHASPTPGAKLEVMASYDDPQKFLGLITYDVR